MSISLTPSLPSTLEKSSLISDWDSPVSYASTIILELGRSILSLIACVAEVASSIFRFFAPPAAPYTPEKYSTISKAWSAPIPKPSKTADDLMAGLTLVLGLGATLYIRGRLGIPIPRPGPGAFLNFLILFPFFAGTYAALNGARNLSYRITHVVQTAAHTATN